MGPHLLHVVVPTLPVLLPYLERGSGCDEQIGMHCHHMHCCWDPKHYWGHSCGLTGHSPAALLRSLSRREVFELLWVAGHGPRLGSILLASFTVLSILSVSLKK